MVPTGFTVIFMALIAFTVIIEWGDHVMAMRRRNGMTQPLHDPSTTAGSSDQSASNCNENWNLASVIEIKGKHGTTCKAVLTEKNGEVMALVPLTYYEQEMRGTEPVTATTVVDQTSIQLIPSVSFGMNDVLVFLPLVKPTTSTNALAFLRFSEPNTVKTIPQARSKVAPPEEGIAAVFQGNVKCIPYHVVDDEPCSGQFGHIFRRSRFCARTDQGEIDVGCGTPFFVKEGGKQVLAGMRLGEDHDANKGHRTFAIVEMHKEKQ